MWCVLVALFRDYYAGVRAEMSRIIALGVWAFGRGRDAVQEVREREEVDREINVIV